VAGARSAGCRVRSGSHLWQATFASARGAAAVDADELPIIGRSSKLPALVYATGHYRNGVLLAPFTARAVADLILDNHEDPLLAGVRPQRFGALRSRPWRYSPAGSSAAAEDSHRLDAGRARDPKAVHVQRFSRCRCSSTGWCPSGGCGSSSGHHHQLPAGDADHSTHSEGGLTQRGFRRRGHGRRKQSCADAMRLDLKRNYSRASCRDHRVERAAAPVVGCVQGC
jgi:hypothetical protein